MPIEVTAMLHAGVRIKPGDADVENALAFYRDVLGLQRDVKRPTIPGIPGYWMNLRHGDRSQQIHIFGAEGVSPMGRSAKEDPTRWHLAFAVKDIAAAEAELKSRNIYYWIYDSLVGNASKQVFFEDPSGNMIELQQ